MKIESKILRSALEKVRTLVSGRTLPILTCVRLDALDGVLAIHATDLEQHQIERVDCDGSLYNTCVNTQRLFAAVPEGKLTITEKDGRLEIKCGKSVVHLATQKADQYPAFPDDKTLVLQSIPCADVAEGIQAVEWAASTDRDNKPRYCHVHIQSSAKMLMVEATDGRQFAVFERPLMCPEMNLTFPIEFASRVAAALDSKGAKLRLSDKGLLVEHDTGSYYCKQSAEKYFDTSAQRSPKMEQIGELELAPTLAILDTCNALVDPLKTPEAHLDFYETGLQIEFQGLDSNVNQWVEGTFLKHECRVNITALRKSLKAIKAEKCAIFNCNEGLALAMTAGDLRVISMNLAGGNKK